MWVRDEGASLLCLCVCPHLVPCLTSCLSLSSLSPVLDIFWVFGSASVFGSNVMVEVATKAADNPALSLGKALHLPFYRYTTTKRNRIDTCVYVYVCVYMLHMRF